jgi:quinol monooxygenase YgiN
MIFIVVKWTIRPERSDAGAAHVNSDHFRTAMAWMPEAIAESPEIINVKVPADGWARMAELTPSRA